MKLDKFPKCVKYVKNKYLFAHVIKLQWGQKAQIRVIFNINIQQLNKNWIGLKKNMYALDKYL